MSACLSLTSIFVKSYLDSRWMQPDSVLKLFLAWKQFLSDEQLKWLSHVGFDACSVLPCMFLGWLAGHRGLPDGTLVGRCLFESSFWGWLKGRAKLNQPFWAARILTHGHLENERLGQFAVKPTRRSYKPSAPNQCFGTAVWLTP